MSDRFPEPQKGGGAPTSAWAPTIKIQPPEFSHSMFLLILKELGFLLPSHELYSDPNEWSGLIPQKSSQRPISWSLASFCRTAPTPKWLRFFDWSGLVPAAIKPTRTSRPLASFCLFGPVTPKWLRFFVYPKSPPHQSPKRPSPHKPPNPGIMDGGHGITA